MAKGKKNSQRKPTRYQRTLQIVVVVISILLALSMILSAINI